MCSNQQQQLWEHTYRAVGLEPPPPQPTSTTQPGPRAVALKESPVSSLELHHSVKANYPSVLLRRDAEVVVLHKPFDAEHRHPPRPLIYDDDVRDHAGRDGGDENSFASMYRATAAQLKDCKFTRKDIVKDVAEATRCHGSTTTGALLFSVDGGQPQVRIRRTTVYRYYDDAQHDMHDYSMPLAQFLALQASAQWYRDLVHLIGIADDRAARHVRNRLERATDPTIFPPQVAALHDKFIASFGKPERNRDYDRIIDLAVPADQRVSLFPKPKPCIHCRKATGSKNPALVLPCPGKHIVGKTCLASAFPSRDFAKAKCPECGTPIFPRPEAIDRLKLGVAEDNVYRDSRLFTPYENFERSCADLDKCLARDNTSTRITVHPDLLIPTWYKMVHDGMEPGTPQHLKPILAPEFKMLEHTLTTHIQRLEGVSATISNLDRFLTKQIFTEFHLRWLQAGLDSTLGHMERGRWFDEREVLRKMLPVGFAGFVRRMLNRTLQFQALRICGSCADGVGQLFHKHGGREYYDPRNLIEVDTRARREVFMWQKGKSGKAYLRELNVEENKRESVLLGTLGER